MSEVSGEPIEEALRNDGDPFHLLLAVQHSDTLISQLEHRLASLDEKKELEEAESTFAEISRKEGMLRARRQEILEKVRELERQVATIAERTNTLESRMYSSTGAGRDLQAIDQEVHHLADRRAGIEEEELELMISQEPLDQELEKSAQNRAVLESSIASLRSALEAASKVVHIELEGVLAHRASDASRLPTALSDHYEVLRARFRGTGAAALVGNKCDGCHLELASAEVERIRNLPPDTVIMCEQCGRILVRVARTHH